MKFGGPSRNYVDQSRKMKTRVCILISQMNAYHARIDSHHEETIAIMKPSLVNTEARKESSQI
jgi:hypothetical protein